MIITKELIESRIIIDKNKTKRLSKSIIIMLQKYYGQAFFDECLQIIFTKIITDFPGINLSENKLRMIRYRHANNKSSSQNLETNQNKTNQQININQANAAENAAADSIIDQIFSKKSN